MTDSTTPTPVPAPAPTGLQAKANELGLKLYLKSPPPVQNALLQGFVKAQPVIAKVTPHAKQILGGGVGVVVLRRLKNRGK